MIMHKKIGLEKALLTFPSYVLLTNELHPLSDETTILGEALFIEHSLALCIIYKSAGYVNGFLNYFLNHSFVTPHSFNLRQSVLLPMPRRAAALELFFPSHSKTYLIIARSISSKETSRSIVKPLLFSKVEE